jgi:hypothetical protein
MRALSIAFLAILLAVSLGLAAATPRHADAQLFSYRLIGGPYNRYITININPAVNWSWYNSASQNAIASWNLAKTSSGLYVVSFTQTTNWSISALDYHANNYGADGLRGVAAFFP